jgi:membrane protein YqaA with SNARE-associated domain
MSETAPAPQTPTTPAVDPELSRRSFLLWGWGAFVAFLASSLGGFLRYFLPNVLYEPSQKFRAGKVLDYPMGVTIDKPNRVWIVRNEHGL